MNELARHIGPDEDVLRRYIGAGGRGKLVTSSVRGIIIFPPAPGMLPQVRGRGMGCLILRPRGCGYGVPLRSPDDGDQGLDIKGKRSVAISFR